MQTKRPSLIARDDTFLGVCEGIGEEFGFNPLILRLTFAVLLLWNPVVVLSAYVALGVAVAVSRWLFPDPRRAVKGRKTAMASAEPAKAPAGEDETAREAEPMAEAA